MASKFIGFSHGAANTMTTEAGDITVGTSTGSTDIELRVDTGKKWNRGDILKALMKFEAFFMSQSDVAFSDGQPT